MEEREIDLLELWEGIKKRLWKIILFTIMVSLIVFLFSKFVMTPQYESSVKMMIGRPKGYGTQDQLTTSDIQLNRQLVPTYTGIIKSRSIAERVVDNLGLNMSLEEFQNRVTVSTVENSEIIQITVRDTIPERAMDIANETAEIFQVSVKEIMEIDNVQILDEAILPENPVSPNIIRNTILAAVVSFMAFVLLASVFEVLDNSIKTTDDIQGLGLTVIAEVPRMKNGGK